MQHLRKTDWTGRQKGICYTTQAAEQAAELWPNDGECHMSATHISSFALFHDSQTAAVPLKSGKASPSSLFWTRWQKNINDAKLEFFMPGPPVCPMDFDMARNFCWFLAYFLNFNLWDSRENFVLYLLCYTVSIVLQCILM